MARLLSCVLSHVNRPAGVENEDLVRVPDEVQAVRDRDDSCVREVFVDHSQQLVGRVLV